MEQYRITDRVPKLAQGPVVELSEACITALLAMTHYAQHPSDANEYELEIAFREIRRLRYVYRWRGETH